MILVVLACTDMLISLVNFIQEDIGVIWGSGVCGWAIVDGVLKCSSEVLMTIVSVFIHALDVVWPSLLVIIHVVDRGWVNRVIIESESKTLRSNQRGVILSRWVICHVESRVWIRAVVLIVTSCLKVINIASGVENSCEVVSGVVIVPDKIDAVTRWIGDLTRLVIVTSSWRWVPIIKVNLIK
jgi:hypothetical protein